MSIRHVIIACLTGVMHTLSWVYEWQWLGMDSRFTMGLVTMFVVGVLSHHHGRWVERAELNDEACRRKLQEGLDQYREGTVRRGGINRKPPGQRPQITIVGTEPPSGDKNTTRTVG